MRLNDDERAAIKVCAGRHFGAGAKVTLFGSRADDTLRGGDIDLHIIPETAAQAAFSSEAAFLYDLQERLGEQRIDITIQEPGAPDRPIDRIARQTGVVLSNNPLRSHKTTTNRDRANLMEKVGAIESAQDFFTLVLMRNRPAHKYPADPARIAGRLNDLWRLAPGAVRMAETTTAYVERRGLART
jgi:hypothetical protein